jgi:hypothetical protein
MLYFIYNITLFEMTHKYLYQINFISCYDCIRAYQLQFPYYNWFMCNFFVAIVLCLKCNSVVVLSHGIK